jgi:hypothetical protein
VFPLRYFFPVDLETAADARVFDYVDNDLYPSAELPGKQNPLEHSDITYSFFLLLALEIATALLYPILMHSLIL